MQLLITSVQCLWIYDYFLTLGDEINYAWSGRKSWVFALFIANRYIPVLHIIWVNLNMFHYEKPFCQGTKWFPILYGSTVTILAQMAVALRIYAITGRNKFLGGVFTFLIATQICSGIFSVVWIALHPLQPLPEIDLDVFKICIYKRWKLGELIYFNTATFFDLFAFLVILVTAKKSRIMGYPAIPGILDTILRDATQYFLLIFFVQFLSQLFFFVTPEAIQLFPGVANVMLVPVMASRLMLSLKKAGVQPKAMWSIPTMTDPSGGRSTEDGTIRFASQVPGGLREISLTPAAQNEEGIELDAIP
ncbi:hypothetical protein BDM02DRAFT_3124642 [Thelephora ganbajun]|uniref:Uncharacterized protein n=1 Tax=Thelephora ganbajun TaxID=370292 RepID=A0ACB6YY17_THEGA|nr:hypothetical protein BDM02DRAFT_3124642 [Thelephora ganbajun]